MISQKHLNDFGIPFAEIKKSAFRNLSTIFNKGCKLLTVDLSEMNPRCKPFYSAQMDRNFNPSLMLIDEVWDNVAKILKSDLIAVSIPSKDSICFSDMKLMESFRTMTGINEREYKDAEQKNLQLTQNIYVRKNGKWVLFLDTPEQMEELWGDPL